MGGKLAMQEEEDQELCDMKVMVRESSFSKMLSFYFYTFLVVQSYFENSKILATILYT